MSQNWKYYTYELVDPRCGTVFYVGKGCGDRLNQHERDAMLGRVCNQSKHDRIVDCLVEGASIISRKTACFYDEREAYLHEAELISEGKDLTNSTRSPRLTREQEKQRSIIKAQHYLTKFKTFDHFIRSSKGRTGREALLYWEVKCEMIDMANGIFNSRGNSMINIPKEFQSV